MHEDRLAAAMAMKRPGASTSAAPSSLASVPRPDTLDPDAVPPAPSPLAAASLGVSGLFVALLVTLMTGGVLAVRYEPLPRPGDWIGAAAFFVLPAVALVLFLARWWGAMKSRARDPGRWVGLSVPFFVVVGIATGTAAMQVARPPEDRGVQGFRDSLVCEGMTGLAGGPVHDACVVDANRCQTDVIASGGAWDDYVSCVAGRLPVR